MSKTDLVVLGSGGFGREVMWLIETNPKLIEKYSILGYVDDSAEKQGCEITYLDVDEYGLINPEKLEKEIRPDTILISLSPLSKKSAELCSTSRIAVNLS